MSTRNVVAWSAIILGHVKCGQGHKALELSSQMQQEGVEPNPVTFVGILNACASIEALKEGKDVHEQIIQSGWESNVSVGSNLVDMYAKRGSIDEAWRVFNSMPKRDVVAWNAMILGYAKCGQGQKALQLSCQMQYEGVHPVPVTFVGMLNAWASVAALEEGRHIHGAIIQSGYESDVFVGSSLIDMYAKCGSVEDAWRVFNRMPRRNMVAWTAMLGAYAMHGHANEALAHFKRMCEQGVEIDDITFLSLLSACRHAGLVDEGLCYFQFMNSLCLCG
jgi:pentatricopeptide repeat protein